MAAALSVQAAWLQAAAAFWSRAATLQRDTMTAFDSPSFTASKMTELPATSANRAAARKINLSLEEVGVGTVSEFTRQITQSDIDAFAMVSGDVNPVHLDEGYAKQTFFNGPIAHGILTAGLISSALYQLPGLVIYVSQDLKFIKPVRPGDTVTARVEVLERLGSKPKFRARTTCANQDGELVLDGEAVVLLLPDPVGGGKGRQ